MQTVTAAVTAGSAPVGDRRWEGPGGPMLGRVALRQLKCEREEEELRDPVCCLGKERIATD